MQGPSTLLPTAVPLCLADSDIYTDLVLDVSPSLLLLRLFLQLHAQAPLAFSQQILQFGHAASSEYLIRRSPQNASLGVPLVRELKQRKYVRERQASHRSQEL